METSTAATSNDLQEQLLKSQSEIESLRAEVRKLKEAQSPTLSNNTQDLTNSLTHTNINSTASNGPMQSVSALQRKASENVNQAILMTGEGSQYGPVARILKDALKDLYLKGDETVRRLCDDLNKNPEAGKQLLEYLAKQSPETMMQVKAQRDLARNKMEVNSSGVDMREVLRHRALNADDISWKNRAISAANNPYASRVTANDRFANKRDRPGSNNLLHNFPNLSRQKSEATDLPMPPPVPTPERKFPTKGLIDIQSLKEDDFLKTQLPNFNNSSFNQMNIGSMGDTNSLLQMQLKLQQLTNNTNSNNDMLNMHYFNQSGPVGQSMGMGLNNLNRNLSFMSSPPQSINHLNSGLNSNLNYNLNSGLMQSNLFNLNGNSFQNNGFSGMQDNLPHQGLNFNFMNSLGNNSLKTSLSADGLNPRAPAFTPAGIKPSYSEDVLDRNSDDDDDSGDRKPRRWTDEEDQLLQNAVAKHGAKNWKQISLEVPNRNHVQCLQRWKKALDPSVVKGHWSPEEDARLLELVAADPKNWGHVAKGIEGRTAKQCRERYHNHLDPKIKKGDWTLDEDVTILRKQREIGNKWAVIAKMLNGRTENSVKIRWKSIKRQVQALYLEKQRGLADNKKKKNKRSTMDQERLEKLLDVWKELEAKGIKPPKSEGEDNDTNSDDDEDEDKE